MGWGKGKKEDMINLLSVVDSRKAWNSDTGDTPQKTASTHKAEQTGSRMCRGSLNAQLSASGEQKGRETAGEETGGYARTTSWGTFVPCSGSQSLFSRSVILHL